MQIIKIDGQKVELKYSDRPGFSLKMDFGPIIENFGLTGNFCLLHWQAKPKGERLWGVWDDSVKQYFSRPSNKIIFSKDLDFKLISIPEIGDVKPTAVILFQGAIAVAGENNRVRIDNASS